MKISIIIPTRNRAQNLKNLLEKLSKQTVPSDQYEVLVIDNGSEDDTSVVCQEYMKLFVNFKYFYEEEPGLHVGRNKGFQESLTELLVYIDDDIEPHEEWLQAIIKGFEDEKVALIGGNDVPKFEKEPDSWINDLWIERGDMKILPEFSCILLGSIKKEIDPECVYGCNFAIRKEVLRKTRGFHPDGMPNNMLQYRGDGETYVSRYIKEQGLKAIFIPEASVYHLVSKERMTKEYCFRIYYRTGISLAYVFLREKRIMSLLKEILYRKIYVQIFGNYTIYEKCKIQKEADGMQFLLKNFLVDKKVREWIVRIDYLNDNAYSL